MSAVSGCLEIVQRGENLTALIWRFARTPYALETSHSTFNSTRRPKGGPSSFSDSPPLETAYYSPTPPKFGPSCASFFASVFVPAKGKNDCCSKGNPKETEAAWSSMIHRLPAYQKLFLLLVERRCEGIPGRQICKKPDTLNQPVG